MLSPPVPLGCPGNDRTQGRIVGHVEFQRFRFLSLSPDRIRHGLGAVVVPVSDHDKRSLARHGQRARAANARSGSGDDGDTVFQYHSRTPWTAACYASQPRADAPRPRRRTCATINSVSDTASTIVPMALISGVTPRRMEEKM